MALNIGELVGYLSLDKSKWDASLKKAKEGLKKLGAESDGMNKASDGVGKFWRALGQTALKIATVSSAANTLGAVVPAVGALVASFAVLPAVIGAGVAAMLTWKLGADGVKAAFGAMTPQLDTLKAKISGTFEAGLKPAVADLASILPRVTLGFQGVASAMSGVVGQVAHVASSTSSVSAMNGILGGTAVVVRNVGAALAPVIGGFLHLAAAGVPALMNLTSGIGGAGTRLGAFLDMIARSGKIQEWITNAAAMFRALGSTLNDVIGIVMDVGAAFLGAGTGIGGVIGPVIHQLREFLDSAQGHDALVALAGAVQTVGGVVGQVLHDALIAVAPLIPPLADAFSHLATQVLPILVGAIGFLAPVLLTIATFIQQNISWLGPLAIGIGIWAAAQWVLNAAMDANPIGLLIIAVGALIAIVALIVTHWGPISDFFANIWNHVRDFFISIWTSIVSFLTGVWDGIKSTAATVWNAIKQFFIDWWPFILAIFTGGLGLIIGLIIQHWDQISGFTRNVFTSIRDFFVNIWNSIVDWVSGAARRVWDAVSGAVSGAYNAVVDWLSRAVDWVGSLPGRVLSALGNLGSLLWNAGTSIIRGLLDGLKAAWQSVTSFVSGIAGWIADHKGPLAYDRTLLQPAGLAIMEGLHSGLSDGFEPVKTFIAQVGDTIASSLSVTPTTGVAAAAKEILAQYKSGGGVFEDFSFYGNSNNVASNNGKIMDLFDASGRPTTYDGIVEFLQGIVDKQQRATVSIEHFHPPANASAHEVASDLDWFSKTGG